MLLVSNLTQFTQLREYIYKEKHLIKTQSGQKLHYYPEHRYSSGGLTGKTVEREVSSVTQNTPFLNLGAIL